MSDINLDFTVSNNSINFTVEPNDITITPTDIQLTFNPAITLFPGNSSPTELLYNNMNTVDGIPTVTYDGSNLSLGNVANIKITGGVNGYVLQTDGTGNLDWTAMTGGGGNGTPGGSNTQIQYNDNGTFGGNSGFTFNEITGNVNIPGNLTVLGTLNSNIANANFAAYAGNITVASQGNITSLGILTGLSITGNANVGNIISTGNITAVNFIGNISGSANTANTVTNNAQPNITSVGTLTDLFVSNQNIHLGLNTGNGAVRTIAIGANAGYTSIGDESVAIGANAGVLQSSRSVAIGANAGAIQGTNSIAIGANAGANNQTLYAIAIGSGAGLNNQNSNSIAIGTQAGTSNLGIGSIALGKQAGTSFNFATVINATGANLFATQANSLFIKPIRDVTGNAAFTVQLYYNPSSGEIGYK